MSSLLPLLIPILIILLLVIRRVPKSSSTSIERPDFIKKATDSIHGVEVSVASPTNDESGTFGDVVKVEKV